MGEERRKVVHLSTVHPSTDNRVFRRECRSLARHGYDVTLIAVADQGREEDGVRVIPLPAKRRWRRMLFGVPQALASAWRCQADVYHLHDPELIPTIPVLRLRGAKVVYDAHEDLPNQILDKHYLPPASRLPLSIGARALCWFADRTSSHIIAATEKIADRFTTGRTTVLYNYPDLPVDGESTVRPRPSSAAVYVGVISRARGAIPMIDAISLVKADNVQADNAGKLLLIGPSREAGLIEELTARPGWTHVDYRGRLDSAEAWRLMTTATAGLVLFQPTPAHRDALPNKLFEYMAAGIPVVASDFPLWRSIVREIDCGVLVDPTDPAAIADAIRELTNDPARARAMGERGRRAVRERYNWKEQDEMIGTLYARLIGNGRHAPAGTGAPAGTSSR